MVWRSFTCSIRRTGFVTIIFICTGFNSTKLRLRQPTGVSVSTGCVAKCKDMVRCEDRTTINWASSLTKILFLHKFTTQERYVLSFEIPLIVGMEEPHCVSGKSVTFRHPLHGRGPGGGLSGKSAASPFSFGEGPGVRSVRQSVFSSWPREHWLCYVQIILSALF